MSFRILIVGDVVGKPGRNAVFETLPRFRSEHGVDFCIVNGENAAGGKGINKEIADQLLDAGADVLTLGNHVWDNKDIMKYLDEERFLRPANFPPFNVPGHGLYKGTIGRNGKKIRVFHVMGRVFMSTLDCPFRATDRLIEDAEPGEIIIGDFHAEATSEKKAMGWYLDGRVSILCGTHTHIQTADEQIFPNGMAYISDLGMTGPHESIIGMRKKEVLDRFLKQMPIRYQVASGDVKFQGLLVDVSEQTGKAISVERISLDVDSDG